MRQNASRSMRLIGAIMAGIGLIYPISTLAAGYTYYSATPGSVQAGAAASDTNPYLITDPANNYYYGYDYGNGYNARVYPDGTELGKANNQYNRFYVNNANTNPRVIYPKQNLYDQVQNRYADWRNKPQRYKVIVYQDIYPGIDMGYQGTDQGLGYDFWLRPGANPNQIVIMFSNINRMQITADGSLVIIFNGNQQMTSARPTAYQYNNGNRTAIPADYCQRDSSSIGLCFGNYDANSTLYMDPIQISPYDNINQQSLYSTYPYTNYQYGGMNNNAVQPIVAPTYPNNIYQYGGQSNITPKGSGYWTYSNNDYQTGTKIFHPTPTTAGYPYTN